MKPQSDKLRRIATRLFFTPFVSAIVVFLIVRECVPDVGDGIANGFQKLNVFIAVMFWVTGLCWTMSLILVIYRELPQISWPRLFGWLVVLAFVLLIAIVLSVAV